MSQTKMYEKIIHDFNLPIPMIPELYEYFFDLYDDLYGTKSLLKLLQKECEKYGGLEEFRKLMHDAKNNIINGISSTEAFKKFNDDKNPDFFIPKGAIPKYLEKTTHIPFVKSGNVYNHERAGKRYLSIDLEKACFQILRLYDEDIVFNTDSYDGLIKHFFDSDYMAKSKNLRQVIFGQLAAKRQILVEKYYIGKILSFVLEKGFMKEEDICVLNNDEIIFIVNDNITDIEKTCKDIYSEVLNNFQLKTHVEVFDLKEIMKGFFVKEKLDGTIEFKCIPNNFFAQAYKKYKGLELNKNDLAFLYEGCACHFDEPLKHKEE